ncbi:MAG TPA: ATP-binding protein [Thiobacillaceae bacterium]|nr:ATP-binding protein [Thiobacillaceae bacterium]HNA83195.1 ATP-binding protein [Thiobacillaceae bacterium]HNF88548.1 ATP-binding protein [Thiobacillaceae bacterium]HNH88546.1 ATP-binding protein [Thiobacillaceae bacterium]HNI08651.1 ATP-binding protein [Thiobacillaceae bacterium]
MSDLEQQDLYAALLHEMKNNLVLMSITLDRVPHCGSEDHDKPLDEVRLLCQRASERLMQALFIYKNQLGGPLLNAIDAYSVEDFVAEMALQADSLRSQLRIETEIGAEVPPIWFFDRNMLSMALINALHNSVAYARERIRIRVRVEDGMLCVAIKDDSDGYPPHILKTVEEDKPLTSNGTGLGLRFASIIAKAHTNNGRRGRLCLRNEGGAVFEIQVP